MTAGLLTLLDDISMLIDDVATMSKVATQKTVGVMALAMMVLVEKIKA